MTVDATAKLESIKEQIISRWFALLHKMQNGHPFEKYQLILDCVTSVRFSEDFVLKAYQLDMLLSDMQVKLLTL